MSWFEMSTCRSEWIYTELKSFWIQFEALFSFMTVGECFQKHSLYSWVGMIWFHRSRRFLNSLWECESDGDGFGTSISILDIASYIWDVREAPLNTSCKYVRYFGIVRTMPTYSIRHLDIWSGSLILRRCEDNAYALHSTSGYLIWKSALWPLSLWLIADVWLLQWTNYFSAMTADDWILAEKSNRTFCSPRWFEAMRRHLCVKNCFGDGTWGSMLFCIARGFCKGIWMNHFVLD